MVIKWCLNIITGMRECASEAKHRRRWDLKNQTPGGVTDSSFRIKSIMFVCLQLASWHANKWFPCTPAIITSAQQGCHSGTHCHAVSIVCCMD